MFYVDNYCVDYAAWAEITEYKTMAYNNGVGRLHWLPVSFLLHVKYALSYHNVIIERHSMDHSTDYTSEIRN